MNNGVNNSNISIEPIATDQQGQPVINPTPVPTVQQGQPVIQPASAPTVQQEQPVIVQTPAPVQIQPQPEIQPQKQEVEAKPANETPSLGDNVKIAPVQPMYDENGQVIETKPETKPKPIVTQPTPTPPGEPPQIQVKVEPEPQNNEAKEETPIKQKKGLRLTPLYIIIIIVLIGALIYTYNDKGRIIEELEYNNIVIDTNGKEVELDINSTIVQDLYNKVATTVREDIANPNLDDEMRRYLAYRQINPNKIYGSNCNLFNQNKIYNYTCDEKSFKPTAFKEEILQLEIKKLFGENTKVEQGNIQLGRHCIGGYEYIPERGEYVEGKCITNNAITIKANKNIIKATRVDNDIYIQEEVNYISENKGDIPETLKDGIYTYRFKLDTNFNYAYINKSYRTKY